MADGKETAHEYMDRTGRPPPIGMVPCCKCNAPASFQNVDGGWCAACWPQSVTMRPRDGR